MVGAHIIIVEVSNEVIPKILFSGQLNLIVLIGRFGFIVGKAL